MAESGSFLSRWSQRKTQVAKGKTPDEPQTLVEGVPKPVEKIPAATPTKPPAPDEEKPSLTLEDVKALNTESDFSAFATREVAPDVRNAAMKKLFSDPRYNVMDGMDVYIDDYTQADPIPSAMLRQMVGAQFLQLFESDNETNAKPDTLVENGDTNLNTHHAHADLRLQPDHAPGGTQDPGKLEPGLERNPDPAQRPVST